MLFIKRNVNPYAYINQRGANLPNGSFNTNVASVGNVVEKVVYFLYIRLKKRPFLEPLIYLLKTILYFDLQLHDLGSQITFLPAKSNFFV